MHTSVILAPKITALAFPYSKDLGSAHGAHALYCLSVILECDLPGILNLYFLFTLHAISCCHNILLLDFQPSLLLLHRQSYVNSTLVRGSYLLGQEMTFSSFIQSLSGLYAHGNRHFEGGYLFVPLNFRITSYRQPINRPFSESEIIVLRVGSFPTNATLGKA